MAGGDLLYQLLGAGIALIVGFALVMKAGNKLGWVLVVGAAIYAFSALKPVMSRAQRPNAPPPGGASYYDMRR